MGAFERQHNAKDHRHDRRPHLKLRLSLIWSQAQTTSCRLFLLAAVAAVHVGVQHLDQRLVGLADLGLGPVVLGFEDLDRAALRGRQLRVPVDGPAGVARGVLAQHLVRIVDAQPRSRPAPRPIS
jgi:hypothetical protein